MRLLKILKNKNYLWLFIFLSLVMLVVYPLLQVSLTVGTDIGFWLKVIPKINLFLVIIFAISFSLLATLQIYNFKDKKCSIKKKSSSAATGGIGTILAIVVPACPACIGLFSLFLPAALSLSITSIFAKFSTLLLLSSIILMLLGIFFLGGFRK